MKKVSVIITTYGGENTLERAVLSVLRQTYPNFELIVVDDNGYATPAQQKTQALLQDYIARGQLNYITHDVNKNGSAARNTGFRHACGDYIMFLDDDDEFMPGRIEKQVAVLDALDDTWGACYSSYEKREKNGNLFSRVQAKKSGWLLYPVLMHKPMLLTDNMMLRRQAYEELGGFDESFVRHQDWEFVARLAQQYKIAAVKDMGAIIHLEFRTMPKDPDIKKMHRKKYLEKVKPQIAQLNPTAQKRVVAENLYDIAMQYLKTEGLSGFIREYKEVNMGYFGLDFLVRRVYNILKQKLQSKFSKRG